MESQLQKSVNIKSLPNNPNLINNQANQQLLEELNIDNNLTNEILGEIKKQEKSLQQDLAYNRLIEERKNDIMQPPNPFTNPRANNELPSDEVPSNILTQQPSIATQENSNRPVDSPEDIEGYKEILKSKKNKKVVEDFSDSDDDVDKDLIEDNSESYYTRFIKYISSIYKDFIYTCLFYYIFTTFEVDLIASASLTSLTKINFIKYTKYIGAIIYTLLYMITKKYLI